MLFGKVIRSLLFERKPQLFEIQITDVACCQQEPSSLDQGTGQAQRAASVGIWVVYCDMLLMTSMFHF